MKRIKKYMRICLGTALISLTACQPDMDFTNPSADSEANYMKLIINEIIY